jgi:hypothetical protein
VSTGRWYLSNSIEHNKSSKVVRTKQYTLHAIGCIGQTLDVHFWLPYVESLAFASHRVESYLSLSEQNVQEAPEERHHQLSYLLSSSVCSLQIVNCAACGACAGASLLDRISCRLWLASCLAQTARPCRLWSHMFYRMPCLYFSCALRSQCSACLVALVTDQATKTMNSEGSRIPMADPWLLVVLHAVGVTGKGR